nr:hypothetical protein [Acidimicrobiia bacterium]
VIAEGCDVDADELNREPQNVAGADQYVYETKDGFQVGLVTYWGNPPHPDPVYGYDVLLTCGPNAPTLGEQRWSPTEWDKLVESVES